MTRKEIKFTDIVQMIADGTVPEGAKFYTPGYHGSSVMISATLGGSGDDAFLYWEDTPGSPQDHAVELSKDVMSDTWYIEVPEVELSLEQMLRELRDHRDVRAVNADGEMLMLRHTDDLDDLYSETDLYAIYDLLDYTFYKVAK